MANTEKCVVVGGVLIGKKVGSDDINIKIQCDSTRLTNDELKDALQKAIKMIDDRPDGDNR